METVTEIFFYYHFTLSSGEDISHFRKVILFVGVGYPVVAYFNLSAVQCFEQVVRRPRLLLVVL